MWKSKYKCFVIRHRYVCTRDNDLAKVYLSVKKAVRCLDADDRFVALLEDAIGSLEDFARNRGLEDNDIYAGVRRDLSLSLDTCQLSDDEFERARNVVIDCLYDCQELEELADRTSPPVCREDGSDGYDSRATYREIRVRAKHVTRDMSVGNTYEVDYYADVDRFDNKEETYIDLDRLDGGRVRLVSATEDAVTLKWGGEEFHVNFGSEASTREYLVDNPLLSSDSLKLTFSYYSVPNYAELWNMIVSLGHDEWQDKEERYVLFARKNEILHFMDKAIEKGNTGLYVAKALLGGYGNWGTCEISDIAFFRQRLLEYIELGCLAPDNHFGWEWMEVAAKCNDPSDFMEDMDLYYEVLDSAASCGVVEAIDIMDSIWEPEQILEED